MTESNVTNTKTNDDVVNLMFRALDESTEMKKENPLETKDDSKELITDKEEVEDTVEQGLKANSNTREMVEQGGEDLVRQFQKLEVGTRQEDGSLENIPPSMQSTSFQNSYLPLLKEIVEKYSAWLEENKDSLSPEQYDIYCKQFEVTEKAVEDIEAVSEAIAQMEDSDEVEVPMEMRRAQRMMDSWLQLESLGQFPTKLLTIENTPSIQSMFHTLVSKNISCPNMKEFVEKFSEYLEANKDCLSSEQYDIYCKQLEVTRKLVEEIGAVFVSEEVQMQRAQRIKDYSVQLESLGEFPAELVGNVGNTYMQSNMQSFLPKDISLPNMKELIGKFPVCLDENKGSLPSEHYDTSSKQLELTRKVDESEAKSEN